MKTMQISLRPGQKIYLNGAVIRVDRKVTLELLNEATFLLDSHVMQADETTTPLRQLYFVVQTMLIDPAAGESSRRLFRDMRAALQTTFRSEGIQASLDAISQLVEAGRTFEALRSLRHLFEAEAAVLDANCEPAEAA
jgi:flagellar biosynthesis repressor protein FlbT